MVVLTELQFTAGCFIVCAVSLIHNENSICLLNFIVQFVSYSQKVHMFSGSVNNIVGVLDKYHSSLILFLQAKNSCNVIYEYIYVLLQQC